MTDKRRSGTYARLKQHFGTTFVSLGHRDFLFYCIGVIISLTGSLMQGVALGWYSYELTGSEVLLGTVVAAGLIPSLALGVVGGWAADKFNRKTVVVVTQVLALVQASLLLYLTLSGQMQVWHLIALSAFLGTLIAFELPSRFAMIPDLVSEEHCMNAFAVDSVLFYTGRVAGPFMGAFVLGFWGVAGCFAFNIVTYAVELVTLAFIRYKPSEHKTTQASLKESVLYAVTNKSIRKVLCFVAVTSFTIVYLSLMPIFAKDVLKGDEALNGLLIAASEIGALVASLLLAKRLADPSYTEVLRTKVGYAGLFLAASLAVFAFSQNVILSALVLVPAGYAVTILLIGSHALVQESVNGRMRGMISSVFWMYTYMGMQALGGPTFGWMAETFTAPWSMFASAIATALAAALYLIWQRRAKTQTA